MSRLQSAFERIKYSALDYLGVCRENSDSSYLSQILRDAIEENGVEILFNTETLTKTMNTIGADEFEIYRICIMTCVSGFREIVSADPETAQTDLDRYIRNATYETGFTREVIMGLTGCIVSAIGSQITAEKANRPKKHEYNDIIATLRTFTYQPALLEFEDAFDMVVYDGDETTRLDFSKLEIPLEVGVSVAKYYMGYCLLYGIQIEQNEERGLQFLMEAAEAGYGSAAATLGDYYYNQADSNSWTLAYHYYTGYGAMALGQSRQAAVTHILNQKKFNKKFLVGCAVFLVLLSVILISAPSAGLFSPRPVWTGITIFGMLVMYVLEVLRYRMKPYDSFYSLPMELLAAWAFYVFIRVI